MCLLSTGVGSGGGKGDSSNTLNHEGLLYITLLIFIARICDYCT